MYSTLDQKRWRLTFGVSTPLFLPLKDDAAEAASNDDLLAAGAANQLAAKTMERRQLFSNCVST
jgi:hypothetical protein